MEDYSKCVFYAPLHILDVKHTFIPWDIDRNNTWNGYKPRQDLSADTTRYPKHPKQTLATYIHNETPPSRLLVLLIHYGTFTEVVSINSHFAIEWSWSRSKSCQSDSELGEHNTLPPTFYTDRCPLQSWATLKLWKTKCPMLRLGGSLMYWQAEWNTSTVN